MPELSTPLSKNFSLRELLRSATAERDPQLKHQQENPPAEIIDNLRYLTETTLQPIRDRLDYPLHITSGYRSLLVNQLVGGSATSQHVRGEAADCELTPFFLRDERTRAFRDSIKASVQALAGKPLRPEVSENFYLFAFICLHLDELDVDQIIHEYGEDFGHPAWIHVSASRRQNRRQILFIGSYTNRHYILATPAEALAYGT